MKTINYPENKDELRNILIHEDVILVFNKSDFSFDLEGDNRFSTDELSPMEIIDMIIEDLRNLGIVLKVKQ